MNEKIKICTVDGAALSTPFWGRVINHFSTAKEEPRDGYATRSVVQTKTTDSLQASLELEMVLTVAELKPVTAYTNTHAPSRKNKQLWVSTSNRCVQRQPR